MDEKKEMDEKTKKQIENALRTLNEGIKEAAEVGTGDVDMAGDVALSAAVAYLEIYRALANEDFKFYHALGEHIDGNPFSGVNWHGDTFDQAWAYLLQHGKN